MQVDQRTIKLADGKPKPGFLYEFTSQGTKPKVQGLGFAATRDVVSFLRYDEAGLAAAGGPISHALAIGFSQAGRYLRNHISEGFNRDEQGRKEISSIIIPNGTAGFVPGPEYSKVGWCASDTRELSFTGCRVPAENLLGERGRGYAQFLRILDEGRVAIAALATGLAQGCVDECIRYAGQREAFGRRLEQHQAIQFAIADMEARAHTARLAWYDAAARLVSGEPIKKQSAIAKLTASNAAMDNARAATQVFGGYGFMNESPVGRFYRDAKVLEIGEGTSEVQRMLIARELGLDV